MPYASRWGGFGEAIEEVWVGGRNKGRGQDERMVTIINKILEFIFERKEKSFKEQK